MKYVALLFSFLAISSAAQVFPESDIEKYRMAEKMAQCAGYLWFLEEMVKPGSPAAAVAVGDKARAWELPAMFLFGLGGVPDPKGVTTSIIQAAKNQHKATTEINSAVEAAPKMQKEFEAQCTPLASMQELLIAAMRQQMKP